MTTTATAYPTLPLQLGLGVVNLATATLKVTLHTSSYTPNKDHAFFSDTTNEVTGTGYTAGGITLTGQALAYDATNDRTWLDVDDPVWASLTTTYRYAVWWVDTGTGSTSALIAWTDFATDQSPVATALTLVIDTTGLLRIA